MNLKRHILKPTGQVWFRLCSKSDVTEKFREEFILQKLIVSQVVKNILSLNEIPNPTVLFTKQYHFTLPWATYLHCIHYTEGTLYPTTYVEVAYSFWFSDLCVYAFINVTWYVHHSHKLSWNRPKLTVTQSYCLTITKIGKSLPSFGSRGKLNAASRDRLYMIYREE